MKIVRKVVLPKSENNQENKYVIFTDNQSVFVEDEPKSQVMTNGFGEIAAFSNCLVLDWFDHQTMTDEMVLDQVKQLMV